MKEKALEAAEAMKKRLTEKHGPGIPTTTVLTLWDDGTFSVVVRNVTYDGQLLIFREMSIPTSENMEVVYTEYEKQRGRADLYFRSGFDVYPKIKKKEE